MILSFLIFQDSIFSYFSQDDFYHLRTIMDKKFSDIPSFFITRQEGQTFYRPLSREIFNLLMYKSFGLNPLPFYLVNFSQIILISFLIFLLVEKITKRKIAALLAVILYVTNAVHSTELYYLASIQTLIVTSLLLISLINYLSYLETKKIKKYYISFIFFIMALLSHETAIVFVAILVSVEIFKNWNRKIIWRILPFVEIIIIYLLITLSFNSLPNQQVYQPIFSLKSVLNTSVWYTLWNFGFSEMLVDFIGPNLSVNPNLIKWYGNYVYLILFLSFLFFISVTYLFWIFKEKIFKTKLLFLFFVCFLITLSPFLFFPQHKSTYYLSFSSVWFAGLVSSLIAPAYTKYFKILVCLIVIIMFTISYQTIQLNKLTYWAAKRAVAAKYLLNEIKIKYPVVPKGSIFYIKNDPYYPKIAKEWGTSSKQAFYILSGADALKLLYNDSSIQTYFEDKGPLLSKSDNSKIINYVARFPY